jgi:polar amino acid transport system substrate-binding protein
MMKASLCAALTLRAAASLVVAGVSLAPTVSMADVRVCLFPGSPSAALDQQVARAVFKTAGVSASFVKEGIGDGDDDGVSLHELSKAIGSRCDAIAGFPRSPVADASGSKMLFSRGYLRSGYVSVTVARASSTGPSGNVIAATYASPAQLIAVQQSRARLDLENTPEATVDAVAKGRAGRAIVWYPALVAYRLGHPAQHLEVAATESPYAEWQLTFAFDGKAAALQRRVNAALATMEADGRLASLTRDWALPDLPKAKQTSMYRDGPHTVAMASRSVRVAEAGYADVQLQYAVADSSRLASQGRFIKVAAGADDGAPAFNHAQVAHGKSLYASSCAKCHGADMQGLNAPALRGPAFAPASNAHLTIGGVFGYMATNMPADRPGKMKDQDYADIMAFLLYSNGYAEGKTKMTADIARASTTPLNARTPAGQAGTQASQ